MHNPKPPRCRLPPHSSQSQRYSSLASSSSVLTTIHLFLSPSPFFGRPSPISPSFVADRSPQSTQRLSNVSIASANVTYSSSTNSFACSAASSAARFAARFAANVTVTAGLSLILVLL
ncbi:hypothetical protein ACLOJK_027144 [Asimina triloba]